MSDQLTKDLDPTKFASKAQEVFESIATVSKRVDLVFSGEAKTSVLAAQAKSLADVKMVERAVELQRKMGLRAVEKSSETRKVDVPEYTHLKYDVPTVWSVRLPSKSRKVTWERLSVRFSASIPLPPQPALDTIEKYRCYFDAIEMWWVPTDIEVEHMPDPDPIVIGVIEGGSHSIYFELYRWIDETVEDPYFNAIAY